MRSGQLDGIDNRRIARLAKLAGAPHAKAAGVALHARIKAHVLVGEPLLTLHADSPGELEYALRYWEANPDIVRIAQMS